MTAPCPELPNWSCAIHKPPRKTSNDSMIAMKFSSISGLLELPPELLTHVCSFLRHQDMKALRLVSKHFNACTPYIFETFLLWPHIWSFERLIAVSQHTTIRHYVKNLVYDASLLGVPHLLDFRVLWTLRRGNPVGSKQHDLAREFDTQELDLSWPLKSLYHFKTLENCLPKLPALQDITICDQMGRIGYQKTVTTLPSFYQRFIQKLSDMLFHESLSQPFILKPRTSSVHSWAVMYGQLKSGNRLQRLTVKGIDWNRWLGELRYPGPFSEQISTIFGSLKHLELSSLGTSPSDWVLMEEFQNVLKFAVNLESLVLGLRSDSESLFDESTEFGHVCTMFNGMGENAPPRFSWSPLKSLSLRGLVCRESEARKVLDSCRKTLKHLTLQSLSLISEEVDYNGIGVGNCACLVAFFHYVQQHCQLESVKLQGVFCNNGMQEWRLNMLDRLRPETITSQHLLPRLQKYLVEGGECPLDRFAIQDGDWDLKKPFEDSQVPATWLADPINRGDASFRILYKGHNDDQFTDSILDYCINDNTFDEDLELASDYGEYESNEV